MQHRLRPRNLARAKGKDGQAQTRQEAGWHVKKDSRGNLKSTYGYSVHTGVDEDGFIQRQTVTAGNVHDSVERDTLLLGDETALYADAAYSSKETRDKLERFGIADQVQRKGYRNNTSVGETADAMMRSPLSVLVVNAPLPHTKAAMA